MLKAGVFDDFKGATTLLLWGDGEGMASLLGGFDALRVGNNDKVVIGGPTGALTIGRGDGSMLVRDDGSLRWHCSPETVELAADLTKQLLHGAGHQFLAISGLAQQVIIARDEYPADLR